MNEEMINKLFDLVKQTLERQDHLESMFNDMIGSINDAKGEYDTDQRRLGFRERNSEALSKYNDKLKAIEGDDFDVVDNAFAEYDKMENKPEEAEYIAALCAKIDEQLDKIARAYGISEVEAEHDKEGTEVRTNADGEEENGNEEVIAEVKSESEDTEAHEEDEEEEVVEDEEAEDNPEEVEADLKALEEEAKKYK